ncbi:MAG: xylan 1,4-beta-xylosidase, partial [Bacteroidales bacterium]|nr:xylan 1,4-beta-xylosidase [Bacteroidales bacterium]
TRVMPTNDNFRHYQLGLQWGWNHNADQSKWSLFDRPGFLRLETNGVTSGFLEARNTLTQRIFGYHSNDIDSYGTIKLHTDEMKEGDVAGLAVFQDPYAFVGVTLVDGERRLIMENGGVEVLGAFIAEPVIYLRAVASYGRSKAQFFYSLDNVVYTPFGSELNMAFDLSVFTGNKFSIFNYATKEAGGYVDVDWFSTEESFTEDRFYDDRFAGYTEDQLTLERIYVESENRVMLMGTSKTLSVYAVYQDGHEENVTASAEFSVSRPDVIKIVNGQLIALKNGTTTVTVTYDGPLGGSQSLQINVTSQTFPLVSGLLNPSIWETGTFDEASGALVTGQWGFAGWRYDNGMDLSAYKYIVVKLKQPTASGASFCLFDQTSYWQPAVSYDLGSQTQIVVDLNNMEKEVGGQMVPANPASLYIIGFWSNGGIPILIDHVYLSNREDLTPTSLKERDRKTSDSDIVDVYNLMGVKLKSGILRKDAPEGLSFGVYIVGNKAVGNEKIIVVNKP